MDPRKIQLPREIYTGPGVIEDTGRICRDLRFEGRAMVVTGPRTLQIAGEAAIESLQAEGFEVDQVTVDDATMESVRNVQDGLEGHRCCEDVRHP